MSKTLYIYLKGGRGDAHVTDLWDGAAPAEEGTYSEEAGMSSDGLEVGEPYRDIYNCLSQSHINSAGVSAGIASLYGTAFTLQNSNIMPFTGGTIDQLSLSPSGITLEVSDEVAHVKPRQFTKVYTWLIFKEVGEAATYKFRKSEVLGWGANSRTE